MITAWRPLRILLAICGLFSVSGLAPAATTVEFWHSMTGDKNQRLEEIIKDFNSRPSSANQAVVVSTYVGTYVDGINKLRASIMAGKGPHIAQIFEIGTQVMIDSGAIVPLQELAAQDPDFGMDQMLPQVLRYYKVGGTLFSLPFATSNPIIYYNADWFQKAGIRSPPKTFEELEEIAGRLTDKKANLTGITWPLNGWFFEEFLARQGALLVDESNGRKARATRALYGSPEGVRVVEWWARLVDKGFFANVGRNWEPPVENFLAGRSAMLITSTSDVFVIAKKAPFKVATAPIVFPAGTEKIPGGTVVGGNSLWIMKAKPAAERKLAYDFVKFMASAGVQKRWHTSTGYFPIRRDVIASLEKEGFYEKNPGAKTAIDQLKGSSEIPATQGALMGIFPEARAHVEGAIEEVLAKKSTAKQALDSAAAKTDKALARYNKMQAAAQGKP